MDVLSDVLSVMRRIGATIFDNTVRDPRVVETPRASMIASMVMPHSQHGEAAWRRGRNADEAERLLN